MRIKIDEGNSKEDLINYIEDIIQNTIYNLKTNEELIGYLTDDIENRNKYNQPVYEIEKKKQLEEFKREILIGNKNYLIENLKAWDLEYSEEE